MKGGPRKAAVLSDRVEVAAGSPEARGYRVADREVAKPMQAIDRSFHSSWIGNTRLCDFAPAVGGRASARNQSRLPMFYLGRCDSADSAVLAEGWLY